MTREPTSGTVAGDADDASNLLLVGLSALPASVGATAAAAASPLRERLLQRAAHSVRAAAAFHTVRGECDWISDGPGMRSRWLYRAPTGRARRAGEPLRARLLALSPGAAGTVPLQTGVRCEWLVVAGEVDVDGLRLALRDYHVTVPRAIAAALCSTGGALLYLREAPAAAGEAEAHTARDCDLPWLAHAPGIERRVLWQRDGEAALLYRVQPGSSVPHHGHGHDEECLMLEGDAFVDDVLLRAGDYQLAPAGTHHEGVDCDTGGILFGHGDIELAVTRR